MSPLHLYISNRLENLLEALAEVLKTTAAPPLETNLILVQSRGMESWLSLGLARHFGVWANFEFPFPNALIDRILASAVGEEPATNPFEREVLTLRILRLLPGLLSDPAFESLNHFLGGGQTGLKSYQLAHRLAHLFDQYSLYRPDLLVAWERGEERDWQAGLWRLLAADTSIKHRACRHQEFLRTFTAKKPELALPPALHIFGVSTLPPFHLEVLKAVSTRCPIHLFLLNPCPEFWFDAISPQSALRRSAAFLATEEEGFDSLHYDIGHPLLGSWGATGRDFFARLWEEGELLEKNLFSEPGQENLLGALQSDIFQMRNRVSEKEKTPVHAHDRSLQLHSCHTPLREIEALHDYLLECFQDDPELSPSDVLIMAPEIETYSPYISAVFTTALAPSGKIPFTIADLSAGKGCRLAVFFLEILALRNSRHRLHQLLDLLDVPEIMSRFGFHPQDLEQLCYWVKELHIRWGLDGEDRARFRVPPFQENSWRAGLERLLMGYACPDGGEIFQGILPFDGVEGENALILGRLAEFIAAVTETEAGLRQERSLEAWGELFLGILERFFQVEENSQGDYSRLEELFLSLATAAAVSDFDRPVAIDVAEAWLKDRLALEESAPGRFLSGGVTFAALLPMRSIPFKIIALIGMNDGAFPRKASPLAFDRMAAQPRRGDRSLRNEDRYLFLETLLSARKRFCISFVGQSLEDGSPLPPSVLVAELLEYLEKGFDLAGHPILFRHRLQAFHPAYFSPSSPLKSYSLQNYLAAQARRDPPATILPDPEPLPEPEETWKTLDWSLLAKFYGHPARFFLQQRLKFNLEQGPVLAEEREPVAMTALDRYDLGQSLTEAALGETSPLDLYPRIRQQGMLPPGEAGRICFTDLALEAESFAASIRSTAGGASREKIEISLEIGGFRIIGMIPNVYGDKIIFHRFAKIKAKDCIAAWIARLILDLLPDRQGITDCVLFGKERQIAFAPVGEAATHLEELLKIYWQGLMRPLPFFPESSLAFASELHDHPEQRKEAHEKARHAWEGNFHQPEKEDPYYRFTCGDVDPLGKEFENLALRVFLPLLRNQEKIR